MAFNKIKRGLILKNAYANTEGMDYVQSRLQEEFKKLGVKIDILSNDFFCAFIDDNGNIKTHFKKKYDFCIYLNKDKYISALLEKKGMKIFNKSQPISLCDDKFLTFITLSNNDIPMPKTLGGLLSFSASDEIKDSSISKIERELGYPLVVKSSYGSFGKGVHLIENRTQLKAIMQKLKTRPHLFQKYISSSHGKDIRVTVIGGKVVSAIKRQSSSEDFRSNLALGGTATPFCPPSELVSLCEKTAKLLDLDYCGIDVLFGENGDFLICEVNSNAIFKGSEQTTKINIAELYANHIYKNVYKDKGEV